MAHACRQNWVELKDRLHANPSSNSTENHFVYVTVDILLEGEHILVVESDGNFILFWNLKFKC